MKNIVITGAGGVLCSMFAEALAATGAKVALLDLNIFGWGTIIICIIATIILTVSKGNKNYREIPEEREAK